MQARIRSFAQWVGLVTWHWSVPHQIFAQNIHVRFFSRRTSNFTEILEEMSFQNCGLEVLCLCDRFFPHSKPQWCRYILQRRRDRFPRTWVVLSKILFLEHRRLKKPTNSCKVVPGKDSLFLLCFAFQFLFSTSNTGWWCGCAENTCHET